MEFGFFFAAVMENESWVAELSANWNEILPLILHYEPNDTISEKLREFYFGSLDQPLTNESFGQLSKVSTSELAQQYLIK